MFAALDLGGTKLLATTAADWAEPRPPVRRTTPGHDPLETLVAMLDELRGGGRLSGIAVAAPGPFERAAGRLVDPPNMPPAWHGLEISAPLSERYGCPVLVENDANCAAVAESRWGAGAGLRTVVYITVSTGIGTGVVRDGRPLLGRHDSEGGHVVLWPEWLGGPACHCGGAGCLEALASGRAIERRFGRPPERLDDAAAWAEVGRWLGLAVVAITALHDPDAVVLGGGVCAAADRFWPALTATVKRHLHLQPCPALRRAALGEDRNLRGALALLGDATR